MATRKASDNRFPLVRIVPAAEDLDPTPSGEVHLRVDSSDLSLYWVDDTGTRHDPGGSEAIATAHVADTSDAHDASAISVADAGTYFTGSDVEAVLQEIGAAGPGGGGVTPAYLGYNTVGGTQESMTARRMLAKSVTPASDCVLQNIEWYTRESADGLSEYIVALHADNGGTIGTILAMARTGQVAYTNNASFANNNTVSVPRWYGVPLTYKLTGSTTYWIGVFCLSQTSSPSMYYDASGTDRRYDSTGDFLADGGRYTQTDTTRKYSIRALTI